MSAAAKTASAAPRDGETSAEAVARYVRKLIFDGRLEAGQRLPQDEIASAVGVSRIPVREAIISLEREGWLRVENHRGAFVYPLDEQAIIDRFALSGRFYGFAARRSIERMGPDNVAALNAFADDVAKAAGAAAMDKAHTGYLAALVVAADSNRLRAVLRSTAPIVPGNLFAAVPECIPVARSGIERMHAAVCAGRAHEAEDASVEMQARQAKLVIAMRATTR